MNRMVTKTLRGVLWLVVIVAVTLAILISTIRFSLPHLDHYRQPIAQWLSQQTHTKISVENIDGRWLLSGPEIKFNQLSVAENNHSAPLVKVEQAEIYLDFWQSLMTFKPAFKHVQIEQFDLDITQLPHSASKPSSDISFAKWLEQFFFTRIDNVTLKNATVTVPSPSGKALHVAVTQLNWRNEGGHHFAQGSIGLINSPLGQVDIKADITEQGSLSSVNGTLYLKGKNISVTPWLNKKFTGVADISDSKLSMQAWLSLDKGTISSAMIQFAKSHIDWTTQHKSHQIIINGGVVALNPTFDKQQRVWRIDTEKFNITTDKISWPKFDVAAQFSLNKQWHPVNWKAALTNIKLDRLLPLRSFLPKSNSITEAITELQPTGW
uniref:YhdP family protein n=1 Tax=Photobacterium angustum TaxID=661 RepID=UPI000B15EF31|nr:hypothetical protein [Photobacterium angustum]